MAVRILIGDVRERLREVPDASVQTCVTSPPYFGLRDYGHAGQIGLESTPDAFVAELVAVFREVWRVLRDDGTLWLNLGDSYASGKNLLGVPWRVAFALQADGWYLRSDIIWHKPNPMPESVTDRPTKAHEYLFLLAKSERYYYDSAAIAEPATAGTHTTTEKSFGGQAAGAKVAPSGNQVPGKQWAWGDTRNRRSVWTVPSAPFKGAHFATFPPALIEPCIKAGSKQGDTVLDPFGGAGTTGLVADRLGRNALLCELNPAYAAMAEARIKADNPMFSTVEVAA